MKFYSGMTVTFFDTGSIYNGGYAFSGGAIFCSFCQTMSFTSVIFSNNIAWNGGAISVFIDNIPT